VSDAAYDVVVVGGGIVGLATMRALLERRPDLRVALLEKEPAPARHQTGHNSGVLHAGIYYRPGSVKARLCVEGTRLMREFCAASGIPILDVGKVIVAVDAREVPRLRDLFARGTANGVRGLEHIGPDRLREIEPHVAGVEALYSPHTASLDYAAVAEALAADGRRRGAAVVTGARVTAIRRLSDGLVVRAGGRDIQARYLVNCAGLYADVVARLAGATPGVRIVPFRGEYYFLRPERGDLVRGLIYPVPDPELPFLGVHFTRTVGGRVEAGPNAVLAFAREGYAWTRLHPGELLDTLSYPGFWRLARRYWRTALYEVWRSLWKAEFVRALQRLVPALRADDLITGGAGVRAQAVVPDGALFDDFHIVTSERAVHVLNAPSPAATASLAIGRHVATEATRAFGLSAGR
jgi:L-2-hydroxyglutarate oxidase